MSPISSISILVLEGKAFRHTKCMHVQFSNHNALRTWNNAWCTRRNTHVLCNALHFRFVIVGISTIVHRAMPSNPTMPSPQCTTLPYT